MFNEGQLLRINKNEVFPLTNVHNVTETKFKKFLLCYVPVPVVARSKA